MNAGSVVFDTLGQKIEELLHEDYAEKGLIEIHSDLSLTVQGRAGTAAGVTKLSEYVFFQFIKDAIIQTTPLCHGMS